ncbi:UNKNOWN [Stylonychia lemnae]|uniref:Uncharacterized protein n=1 Tax=Stylonychia lemnae TaxID=5949 RepID=A0A078AJS9_STYLE|nr:UNKNOWN [Stylonychia lemnae]|eukprot:CDW82424.1 UNKNOWN [Stylonychia lemnae]
MRPAIAFDATGVFYKSRKALPRARQALELLQKKQIPFLILTNASDPTDKQRADFLNELTNTNILKPSHIVQGHTPVKIILEQTRHLPGITLVGGGMYAQGIAENSGITDFITVPEISACMPELVPLDHKAGYPHEPEKLIKQALERLKLNKPSDIIQKQFKDIMIFTSPSYYEAHMQIMSDLLISKDGWLGTQRKSTDKQHVKLYYSHHDYQVPYANANFPSLRQRFSMGMFKQCLETIFKMQYNLDIEYQLLGKPSKLAFDYARNTLKQQTQTDNLDLFMVGDSPEIDIVGGNQNGFKTILVKSGNYTEGMESENPDFIVQDVYDAVLKVMELHQIQ